MQFACFIIRCNIWLFVTTLIADRWETRLINTALMGKVTEVGE